MDLTQPESLNWTFLWALLGVIELFVLGHCANYGFKVLRVTDE